MTGASRVSFPSTRLLHFTHHHPLSSYKYTPLARAHHPSPLLCSTEMSASPEFYYNPSAAPAFSPCGSPPLPFATAGGAGAGAADLDYYCRTPTGAGISYLREPDTCPPAPRKPRPPPAACSKRLFNVDAISLRLDDLERIFRPSPPQPHCDKRRRSPDRAHDELSSNPASTSSSGASSVA